MGSQVKNPLRGDIAKKATNTAAVAQPMNMSSADDLVDTPRLGIWTKEEVHLMAILQESSDQVGSHETCSTGYQGASHCSLRRSTLNA